MWNYIVVMASGCGMMMLVYLFIQYRPFWKRKIPGLNDCIYMMGLAFAVLVVSLAALLMPGTQALNQLVAYNFALSMLGNALCYRILLYLMGVRHPRARSLLRLLYVAPVVALVAAAFDGRTHFIIQDVAKMPDGFGYHIQFGPGLWWMNAYTIVVILLIVGMAFYQVKKQPKRRRNLLWILLLTALVPQSMNLLEAVFPYLGQVHISSLAYGLPGILLIYVFYGYLQTARKLAVESANEVYVVFDRWGDCVDINHTGESFFQLYARTSRPVFADLLRILGADAKDVFAPRELVLEAPDGGKKYYQFANFRISNNISRHCGDGFMIEEVTEFREQMDRLDSLASEDPLTGLKNRRYLRACAPRMLTPGVAVTMLMLDIDLFKNVNDTYGHPVGDEVLRLLCKRCNSVLRKGDVFCRYGGEEFVILLQHTNAEVGRELADRVLRAVNSEPFSVSVGELPITISIGGCTMVATAGAGIEDWIARADAMLYRAKQSGRNRVEYETVCGVQPAVR